MEIQGYENYLIYEDGRVYSKNIKDFMNPILMPYNYKRIKLSHNAKYKSFLIHRLVALHYIPNPDNKETVDHIDRNPLNNSISNLRWATKKEQANNRDVISSTGEKYIYIDKNGYNIFKRNCFRKYLCCDNYTLEDAIMLRDSLLSIEDDVV